MASPRTSLFSAHPRVPTQIRMITPHRRYRSGQFGPNCSEESINVQQSHSSFANLNQPPALESVIKLGGLPVQRQAVNAFQTKPRWPRLFRCCNSDLILVEIRRVPHYRVITAITIPRLYSSRHYRRYTFKDLILAEICRVSHYRVITAITIRGRTAPATTDATL
ncbi:hypothetical protein J6590_066153 [Homalodisca vitripennis]|nr:hypothetical protein J6590_066153 [Homalodisca vitripennis]